MNKKTALVVLSALLISGCSFQTNNSSGSASTTQPPVTEKITITPASTTTPTIDETANIIVDIKKALVSKHGIDAGELSVTVSAIEGDYAKGGVSDSGSGGMWFSAKVNGEWVLVWDGNGIILCSDISSFPDFPKTMIPECYDQKTDKLIKR